jgi:protein-tyrosine phosphatase
VFVHCVAAMERSPLVCLAWLVSRHGQSPQAALDYLMQVHPGTNPLPGQLRLLDRLRL